MKVLKWVAIIAFITATAITYNYHTRPKTYLDSTYIPFEAKVEVASIGDGLPPVLENSLGKGCDISSVVIGDGDLSVECSNGETFKSNDQTLIKEVLQYYGR